MPRHTRILSSRTRPGLPAYQGLYLCNLCFGLWLVLTVDLRTQVRGAHHHQYHRSARLREIIQRENIQRAHLPYPTKKTAVDQTTFEDGLKEVLTRIEDDVGNHEYFVKGTHSRHHYSEKRDYVTLEIYDHWVAHTVQRDLCTRRGVREAFQAFAGR
ncbi:hypothetical protein F5Y18DRAFT_78932 [Xylariaceae sp. FL1019]|nr:hypothetical protein F5Y18DRAFT_78932 [Xylariaceae sp. FL1019]